MRRALLALLLLAAGCQRTSNWQYRHIDEVKSAGCSQLTYRSSDQASGIDVEFLCKDGKLSTYLQVHSEPITPSKEDPTKAEVRVHLEGKIVRFLAPIREGMHRVRLSDVLQSQLISFLRGNAAVTIELSGYSTTIEPGEFDSRFAKLKDPAYQIPFHLFF